jgi:hypothetical protein
MATWDYVDSYRLSPEIVEKFLAELFGEGIDFHTHVSRINIKFAT